MRTRRLAFVAAFSLLAAGCGGSDAGNQAEEEESAAPTVAEEVSFPEGSTMAELNEAGELRVGTKFDQPGFGLLNPTTNQPEGFDVEIAYLIAAALGIPEDGVTFTESVSANREPFIQNDTVDIVVATYTINDTRKTLVSFAGPYYVAGQDIMVAADDDSIESVDDLAGKNVCTALGSTYEETLKKQAPKAKLKLVDSYSECLELIQNGAVDAVSTDDVILTGMIIQDDTLKLVDDEPLTTEPYGAGIKEGDKAFQAFVNEVFDKYKSDGRWAKAYQKWVGQYTGEKQEPPTMTLQEAIDLTK